MDGCYCLSSSFGNNARARDIAYYTHSVAVYGGGSGWVGKLNRSRQIFLVVIPSSSREPQRLEQRTSGQASAASAFTETYLLAWFTQRSIATVPLRRYHFVKLKSWNLSIKRQWHISSNVTYWTKGALHMHHTSTASAPHVDGDFAKKQM
jgi:hypothetical protein